MRRLDMWRRTRRHQLRKDLVAVWRLSAFFFVGVYFAGIIVNNIYMLGIGVVGVITYPLAQFFLRR